MTRPPRYVVNAVKQDVGSGLTDWEAFQFYVPTVSVLHSVQVYCTGITATATVRIYKNGVAITADITPTAGTPVIVEPTEKPLKTGDMLRVLINTDATGTITDLNVSLIIKAQEEIKV